MSNGSSSNAPVPMEGVEQAPNPQSSSTTRKSKRKESSAIPPQNAQGDPVLKVWIMSLNRHVSTDEIVRGLNKIEDEDVRRQCLNKATRDECIRTMIGKLFPPIVLHHKFRPKTFMKRKAENGKEYYIAQEDQTCFGYSIADVGSLVAMAWAMGSMARVVNIGVHVLKYSIPRGTTVKDYFQSVKHKLTDTEQSTAMLMGVDEVLFRRILIMLSFKQAYINAINQPAGFDFRRISCDFQPGKERVTVDGKTLVGWEVYMFKSNLGVQRRETIVEEIYQCCALIYRGWSNGNQWNWNSKKGDMDDSLNFLKVDQIVKAYDGLGDGKRKLAHYKSEKRKRVAAENAERERIEQQGSVPAIPMPPPAAAIHAP